MQTKLIGFTQSVTTCECCGRTDLKGTFEFEGGLFYGSECAKKVTGVNSDLLKVATIKSDFDLVAFNQNLRVIEIQKAWTKVPAYQLAALRTELKKIKSQYVK